MLSSEAYSWSLRPHDTNAHHASSMRATRRNPHWNAPQGSCHVYLLFMTFSSGQLQLLKKLTTISNQSFTVTHMRHICKSGLYILIVN